MRIFQGATTLAGVCALTAFSWTVPSRAQEAPDARTVRVAREAPLDVRFEPDEDGIALLVRNGVAPYMHPWGYRRRFRRWAFVSSYSTACRGTCDAKFMPGTYDLALERDYRVVAADPVTLTRPSILRGHYTDRSGMRVAGIVLGIGGVVAGTIMMFASVQRQDICDPYGYCYFHDTVNGPLLAGGIGVVIVSAVAGSILAWQRDEASFAVFPLTASSLERREGARFASQVLPEGVGVRVAF